MRHQLCHFLVPEAWSWRLTLTAREPDLAKSMWTGGWLTLECTFDFRMLVLMLFHNKSQILAAMLHPFWFISVGGKCLGELWPCSFPALASYSRVIVEIYWLLSSLFITMLMTQSFTHQPSSSMENVWFKVDLFCLFPAPQFYSWTLRQQLCMSGSSKIILLYLSAALRPILCETSCFNSSPFVSTCFWLAAPHKKKVLTACGRPC